VEFECRANISAVGHLAFPSAIGCYLGFEP
jgi:hypothetical protein